MMNVVRPILNRQDCAFRSGDLAAANGVDKRCALARSPAPRSSRVGAFCSSKYGTPTSSFAGGQHGTQIFAAVSGGDRGNGGSLLQEHHNAVIKPLLEGEDRPAVGSSSAMGEKENEACYCTCQKHTLLLSYSVSAD